MPLAAPVTTTILSLISMASLPLAASGPWPRLALA
jgi:hypothetical protein